MSINKIIKIGKTIYNDYGRLIRLYDTCRKDKVCSRHEKSWLKQLKEMEK